MATYRIDVAVATSSTFTVPSGRGAGTNGDPFRISPNDTLTFRYTATSGTLEVSSFHIDHFNDLSKLVVASNNGEGSRSIKADALFTSDGLTLLKVGEGSPGFFYIKVVPAPVDHQATITYLDEEEVGVNDTVYVTSGGRGGSSSNPLKVKAGDTVTFINTHTASASVTGFTSDRFTPTSLSIPANNATRTVTLIASAVLGVNNVNVNTGGINATFYMEVTNGLDTTPNQFDIGSNTITANLNQWYEFAPFILKGTDSPSPLQVISSNCQYRISPSGGWASTVGTLIQPNSFLQIRVLSSSSYLTTVTATLQIGGVSDSVTLRTKADPGEGQPVYFKNTRPVSLTEVSEFFAAPVTNVLTPRNMSAYRRGGQHVPDIVANSAIAPSNNQGIDLKLGKFLNAATSVYFENYPPPKYAQLDTTFLSGTQFLILNWNAVQDWTMGYSPLTSVNMQYRYEYVENTGGINSTGVIVRCPSGVVQPTGSVYSGQNTSFSVEATALGGVVETNFSGVIKVFAKSIINPSLILEGEVNYALSFYNQL